MLDLVWELFCLEHIDRILVFGICDCLTIKTSTPMILCYFCFVVFFRNYILCIYEVHGFLSHDYIFFPFFFFSSPDLFCVWFLYITRLNTSLSITTGSFTWSDSLRLFVQVSVTPKLYSTLNDRVQAQKQGSGPWTAYKPKCLLILGGDLTPEEIQQIWLKREFKHTHLGVKNYASLTPGEREGKCRSKIQV